MELKLNDSPELRTELSSMLKDGIVNVSFIKTDGDRRDMPCTLNEDLIPEDKLPKTTPKTQSTDSVAKVFVTDIQQWRSFRWDSIVSYA